MAAGDNINISDPYNLYYAVNGQAVDISHPNTASGYYLASDQAEQAMRDRGEAFCPDGMRTGRMVIKGLPATENTNEGYLRTCGGRILQVDMPDIHIVNWRYRIYVNGILALLVFVMLAAVTLRAFKK